MFFDQNEKFAVRTFSENQWGRTNAGRKDNNPSANGLMGRRHKDKIIPSESG